MVCPKKDISIFHFILLYIPVFICDICAHMHPNPWSESLIFCLKISGEFFTIIGKYLQQYFPHKRILVHKFLAFLLSQMWSCPMLKSSGVAYLKHSNFNDISLLLGISYGLYFNWLFEFLKLLRNVLIFLKFGILLNY